MELVKITNEIIRIDFPTQELLCKTFLRFQEYYESPKFRNTIFTLGEFRAYYAKEKGGFTYYQDWNGFNVPSYVLEPFRMGLFDPLTEEEKQFLELFPYREERFYIIGTHGGRNVEASTLKHEIAHGMFYADEQYQTSVLNILDESELDEIYKYLKELGYNKAVWYDEAHAYILANSTELKEEKIKFPNISKQLNKELQKALQRCKAK